MSLGPGAPGPEWAERCVELGEPTREMFDALVAAGEPAATWCVEILSHAEWRDGADWRRRGLVIAAIRALGEIRSERALPALLGVLANPGDAAAFGDEAALAVACHGAAALGPVERMLAGNERMLAGNERMLAGRDRGTWVRARAARTLMLAALRDRRLRPRVRAAYEAVLRDPLESDRTVTSAVIDFACQLAMAPLLPAVQDAWLAGRADREWGSLAEIELDLLARRHRPDPAAKSLARRDVRLAYGPAEG